MTRAPQAESWGIHEEAVHISLHSIRLVLLGGGKDQVCLLIDGLQKLPLMPLFSFWVPAKGEDSFLLEATVWSLRHSYILWRDCDGLISAKIWNSNLKCPEPETCVAKGRAQLPLKAAPRHCGAQNLLPFSPVRLTAQSFEDEGPLAQEPVICGPHPSLCMAGFQLPGLSMLRVLLCRQECSFQALWEHCSHKLWCLSSLGAPEVG